MSEAVVTILSSAGISTILTLALIFLTKNLITERLKGAIKNEYDQKLETHKSQLKAQNETELERFKAQLHIAASERNIKLTRVFEKTVDTAAGVYERLIDFQSAVAQYISIVEYSTDPSKEDRRKIAGEKLSKFLEFYLPRRPFLPKTTVDRIDVLRGKLHKTAMDFMIGVEKGGDSRRIKQGEHKDTWIETHTFMKEEVPKILVLLEDELRTLLGIANEEKAESGKL